MSAVSRSSKSHPAADAALRLRRFAGLLVGPARTPTLVVLILGTAAAAWYFGWARVRDRVLSSSEYLVGPEQVEITSPPPWIHSDIRAEVFRNASLDGPLSIMDESLAERLKAAFSLHPWVARVGRISKHHPARVVVELEYRRPVLMVEVPGGPLPVDRHGRLLPSGDFSAVEAAAYPRLLGIDTAPIGTVGQPWGDARVAGAAAVAGVLGPAWRELGLGAIAPVAPPGAAAPDHYLYALRTTGGAEILWGHAPGMGDAGEPSPQRKIAGLHEHARRHGSLDALRGAGVLDLRR
jgi:hypothetical protein